LVGIYRVRCTVNGRYYLGRSHAVKRRFIEHRRALTAGPHYARDLQAYWDAYGRAAFVFEVLVDCDPAVLSVLEQALLDAAPADKLYNATRAASLGHVQPRPVVIDGVRYLSVSAAARALHMERPVVRERLNSLAYPTWTYAPQPADPAEVRRIQNRQGRPVVVDGITYDSMHAAARALGVDYRYIRRRAARNSEACYYA
jgi:hypothetical protein